IRGCGCRHVPRALDRTELPITVDGGQARAGKDLLLERLARRRGADRLGPGHAEPDGQKRAPPRPPCRRPVDADNGAARPATGLSGCLRRLGWCDRRSRWPEVFLDLVCAQQVGRASCCRPNRQVSRNWPRRASPCTASCWRRWASRRLGSTPGWLAPTSATAWGSSVRSSGCPARKENWCPESTPTTRAATC